MNGRGWLDYRFLSVVSSMGGCAGRGDGGEWEIIEGRATSQRGSTVAVHSGGGSPVWRVGKCIIRVLE